MKLGTAMLRLMLNIFVVNHCVLTTGCSQFLRNVATIAKKSFTIATNYRSLFISFGKK